MPIPSLHGILAATNRGVNLEVVAEPPALHITGSLLTAVSTAPSLSISGSQIQVAASSPELQILIL